MGPTSELPLTMKLDSCGMVQLGSVPAHSCWLCIPGHAEQQGVPQGTPAHNMHERSNGGLAATCEHIV